ncbi:hypothetical protein H0I23_01430 [Cellulophaga sp. HaHaR_3_176]|uniref:hypothetical protein n=1 Tax=Cellulophaga sp. HaHaR_3_176 TaxID=1942464 RepID=UPI001C1F9183|nr:hypothetical protein [Cellulophaga sp. HaHaR_3_176]QWX84343.1 hypothetical protein H0I23_01430 [Cellulophaga sp. HaHaR_3_176]
MFSILVFIVCTSCKSQNILQHNEIENIKSVLEAFGNSNEEKVRVFKKSFKDDYYNSAFISTIGQELIINTNRDDLNKVREIKDSLNHRRIYSSFEVDSITNVLTKSLLNIPVSAILNDKDLEKMKNTYLDDSIHWHKKLFENTIVTNNKSDTSVSVPVFNIDNSLALLYVQHNASLSLEFYEKKDGNAWIRKGMILLRRAD